MFRCQPPYYVRLAASGETVSLVTTFGELTGPEKGLIGEETPNRSTPILPADPPDARGDLVMFVVRQ